ncbi:ABC transporter permease [Thermus thermophilus]|uniref:Autoinducer 2 import system permease protein LsrC n=1 Tax=Thermus thermophilus TaxID=274 RepID=A0A7R7YJH3_THETH|nr:ABC transporter permease [Thermus thermophilus]BCP67659.1 ribose ABC transporter permease [Thermus thermophilus]BDG29991.1 ribose ABC transporter permease [Thermus thermophilus]
MRPRVHLGSTGLLFLLCLLLLLAQGLVQPNFLTYAQVINLLKIAAVLGILTIGQTLVVLSGQEGVDLSIGAVATFGAVLVYNFSQGKNESFPIALGLALMAGLSLGSLNGVLVAYSRLPPLVATLGVGTLVQGLIVWLGGRERGAIPPILVDLVSTPWILGLPGILFLWILLALSVTWLLRRTYYGKALYALGSNRRAAYLAGIRPERYLIWTYALSGFFSALGGAILLGHVQVMHLTLGQAYTLPTVVAVVAGGTLLTGGVGSYWGSMAGALLITLLQSVLLTLRIEEFGRQIAFGVILLGLLAVYGREKGLRQ